jgi:serine/threonine protein phosphatase PrpC
VQNHPLIEWGFAGRAFGGQAESGDQHLVAPYEGGVLVAVIDGLGHGAKAAEVAEAVVAVLAEQAHKPVVDLMERCHEQLRGTRGVVMSMASFREQKVGVSGTVSLLGVGNVTGVLLRADKAQNGARWARELLLVRGGVLGHHMPPLRAIDIDIQPGDTLVFATDGLQSRFVDGLALKGTPQETADALLAQYARGTDDALVLVACYVGDASPAPTDKWPFSSRG